MSKLSLLDQLFYKLESGGMSPMYMGGAMIVDPTDSPFPLDGKILADHLAARMEKIPLMRQKLVQDRLKIGDMRLVGDPDFNVKNHITRTRLEAPGDYKQLTDCLGNFSAQRMDLNRPLWRYEVIEGLKGGHVAIAMHLHHAVIDGMGAQEALSTIWSTKPEAPEQPGGKVWQVDELPTSFELIRDALTENAQRLYIKMPTFLLKSGAPLFKATLSLLNKR
ncbi:MAG: wax ester/triacylglycerol synthase domain-containing protein, partial [Pseudomonadales bacterium]